MEIKQTDNGHTGSFYVEENAKQLAEMTYFYSGENTFTIDHTLVKEGGEGKGLGKQLVYAAVEFARKKGYKINPVCPFAKSVFEKTPDYSDVLAHN